MNLSKAYSLALGVLPMLLLFCSDQRPDLEFNTKVDAPAFLASHPRVLFNERHKNFHKASSTYKPFVDLIRNDGYAVHVIQRRRFSLTCGTG